MPGVKRNPEYGGLLAEQRGGADVGIRPQGSAGGGGAAARRAKVPARGDRSGLQATYRRRLRRECVRHSGGSRRFWRSGSAAGNRVLPVPDELLPPVGTLGFRVQRYGIVQWGDLFTARQKLALVWLRRRPFNDVSSCECRHMVLGCAPRVA